MGIFSNRDIITASSNSYGFNDSNPITSLHPGWDDAALSSLFHYYDATSPSWSEGGIRRAAENIL